MKSNHLLAAVLFLAATAVLASGCEEKKGPAERAGERIDHATERMKDAAEDAKRDVKDAAHDIKDAAKDAKDDLDDE